MRVDLQGYEWIVYVGEGCVAAFMWDTGGAPRLGASSRA